jgi:hypothetical protein
LERGRHPQDLLESARGAKLILAFDWYILPIANPDGYAFTRSNAEPDAWNWRKNRNPGGRDSCRNRTIPEGPGVDLNRWRE